MKIYFRATLCALACWLSSVAYAIPTSADIVILVDESGSMAGEHAWLPSMISDLEAGLLGANVGTGDANRYALIGFGTSSHASNQLPHSHTYLGNDWFGAGDYSAANSQLVTNGSREDGWAAIDYFFDNYTARADAALNLILVTDEDRDNRVLGLTYDGLVDSINNAGGKLNSVVNCKFNGGTALGLSSDGTAYSADGSGGFTTSAGGTQSGGCFGTTNDDYVQLAMATGGAAWDLNFLRSGGDLATSFSNAFVDIKVQEIIDTDPPVVAAPEPFSLLLLGGGLGLLGLMRRRV